MWSTSPAQKYVELYQARKEQQQQAAASKAEGEAVEAAAPATAEDDVALDNEVLEKIMTIVSDRASTVKVAGGGASDAANEFLANMSKEESSSRAGGGSRDDDQHKSRCSAPLDPCLLGLLVHGTNILHIMAAENRERDQEAMLKSEKRAHCTARCARHLPHGAQQKRYGARGSAASRP
jgi:hypothetical protein